MRQPGCAGSEDQSQRQDAPWSAGGRRPGGGGGKAECASERVRLRTKGLGKTQERTRAGPGPSVLGACKGEDFTGGPRGESQWSIQPLTGRCGWGSLGTAAGPEGSPGRQRSVWFGCFSGLQLKQLRPRCYL